MTKLTWYDTCSLLWLSAERVLIREPRLVLLQSSDFGVLEEERSDDEWQ